MLQENHNMQKYWSLFGQKMKHFKVNFKELKPLQGLENVLLTGPHHANLQSPFPSEHYLDD